MLNKEQWKTLLKKTGLDTEGLNRFHREFEKLSGEDHQEFLELLGIDAEEIGRIRDSSK